MDMVLLVQSIGAAVVTALATVFIGYKSLVTKAKTEITAAEIQDKAKFRQQLMDRLNHLQEELHQCREEHKAANERIARLERILQAHNIELIER